MGNRAGKQTRLKKIFGSPSHSRPGSAATDEEEDFTDFAVAGAKANNTFLSVRHLVRLVSIELLIYLFLFYVINLTYRFAMTRDQQADFEHLVEYFDTNIGTFARDITFLLGFYVTLVARRWWEQYKLLPWPDSLAMALTGAY
jgi:hypothetical protein